MIAALIALAVVTVASILGTVILAFRLHSQTEQVHHAIHVANGARIEALENKLLAHSWQDYANLQHTPGATDRAAAILSQGFDPTRSPESYGETADDVLEQQLRDSGASLDDFGPILG
jgi:hypothetical protein